MERPLHESETQARLPRWLTAAVVSMCLLPLPLMWLGIDFASPAIDLHAVAGAAAHGRHHGVHDALAASFTHTLLEWSAFCAAIVTAGLAAIHFRITRDVTTPVIGVTLLCAGSMDAFHTLAAVRLLEGQAPASTLIPFSWAMSRMFAALILIAGVGVLLAGGGHRRTRARFVVTCSVVMCVASCYAIYACATSVSLPQTIFPESAVPRPYDLVSLVLLAVVAAPLFGLLQRRRPNLFTHALLVSLVPLVATQAYMAFGSAALFDGPFNVAHFLKIVAYAVPLVGLLMDYDESYRQKRSALDRLAESERRFVLAVRGTSDGLWDWGIGSEYVWYAPRFRELLGYDGDDTTGFADTRGSLDEIMHPDDRERAAAAIKAYLEERVPYDVEYRLRHRDGRYRWFRARGRAERDAAGRAVRMAGSIQDVTVRKETEQLIIRTNRELSEANRELERFVYTVSHDLKSPIVTIQGFVGHLLRDLAVGRTERLDDFATRVDNASRRMRQNIDELLELSRIGRRAGPPEPVDVGRLVRELLDGHTMVWRQHETAVTVDPDLPWLRADRVRITQVFDNLIVNAFKYACASDDARVHVGCERGDGEVRYFVRDNGPGIPPEARSRIFELFQRLDRGPDGSGIGLAIVKRIAEVHEGNAWVESEVGEGSTFYVAFPDDAVVQDDAAATACRGLVP